MIRYPMRNFSKLLPQPPKGTKIQPEVQRQKERGWPGKPILVQAPKKNHPEALSEEKGQGDE